VPARVDERGRAIDAKVYGRMGPGAAVTAVAFALTLSVGCSFPAVAGSLRPGGAEGTGANWRASVNSQSVQGNGASDDYRPAISDDGRYVAFASAATNLVPGDTNGRYDVFVRDLATQTTSRISITSKGRQSKGDSFKPSITPDGSEIVFYSAASNLVRGDTNGELDCFLWRRSDPNTVERVSVSSSGAQGTGGTVGSHDPTISADGNWVSWESDDTNLVPNDTNGSQDAFLRNLTTGVTTRENLGPGGVQAQGGAVGAHDPHLSSDGRWMAFYSDQTNLVPNDTNGVRDEFLRDTVNGVTTRISATPTGGQSNGESYEPWISGDGRYVTFASSASNLVSGDTNGLSDVFLADVSVSPPKITRVSVSSSGAQGNGTSKVPALSLDGGYVCFFSFASNLVSGDTNAHADVFEREVAAAVTKRTSLSSNGAQGNGDSTGCVVSSGGTYVAYKSVASNLVPSDTNGVADVFRHWFR
jgi:Tol biopolymer transport system component